MVDRPGVGPATAASGSPCTVEEKRVVVETGYLNENTAGDGTSSNLIAYPFTLLRAGISKHDEIAIVLPNMSLGSMTPGSLTVPAIGTQDSGINWKHNLHANANYQDAFDLYITYPTGTGGYSYNAATYSLSYTGAWDLSGRLYASVGAGVVDAPGVPQQGGSPRRFVSFQPSVTLGYAIGDHGSIFVNDNVSVPTLPSGGTANVLLAGAQRSLSDNVVLDIETEFDLTPAAGYKQHGFGFGAAFLL